MVSILILISSEILVRSEGEKRKQQQLVLGSWAETTTIEIKDDKSRELEYMISEKILSEFRKLLIKRISQKSVKLED